MNKKITSLEVLLVIGILISLFLLYEHFSPSASKYCTFGESFDCGIVNKGPYANIDGFSYLLSIDYGLPLPLIDLTRYGWFADLITANSFLAALILLFTFCLVRAFKRNTSCMFVAREKTLPWIRGILTVSVIYGLYLIYIQHFILKTYCIFCLGLDVVLIAAFIIAWRINGGKK